MNNPVKILIGSSAEYIRFVVNGRSHPLSDDFWDGNWLTATIEVTVSGISARTEASLRAEDFTDFQSALHQVMQANDGVAVFRTMEEWIEIEMALDSRGRVNCKGVMVDSPGSGNRVHFDFELDRTFLSPLLASLQQCISEFPVVGKP